MKWTIGLKMAIMNGIAIGVLVIINIANYYSTTCMVTDSNSRQESYETMAHLENLLTAVVDAETGGRGYLITSQDHYLDSYNAALSAIPVEFKALKPLISDTPLQQQRLEVLEPLVASKLAHIQSIIKIKDPAKKISEMNNDKKIMDEIKKIIGEMKVTEKELLTQQIKSTTGDLRVVFDIITYGTLVAVIFLSMVGVIITRNIVNPIKEITTAAKKITSGQLDNVSSSMLNKQDEVGVLAQTFSHMTQSLKELAQVATTISAGDLTVSVVPQSNKDVLGNALAQMVANLRQFTLDKQEGIKILNTSVNEISSSIRQLVTTGTETAAAVSETTSTIEEVRQASQISNQKAKSVSENAQQAAQISQGGKKSTQETNEGMMRIRDQMLSIAENMVQLSEQTQGINNIIETVDDLAQQSNLLAVNASIEAEKAGEQGKGFRVVAQEIKSLADQSKQATYRVREILSDVQKATSTAVLSTEQGNKVAEEGIKKSEEAGESISKLSNNIMEAAQAAIQIAASGQQQLVGMEQAATAMESIKEASAQNVENAKQLELAAHNLKELGIKLQQSMTKYRVVTES